VHPVDGTLSGAAVGSLTLKSIDSDNPPDGLYPQSQARGIVIYWRPASAQPVRRRRRQQLQLPLPDWQAQHVGFSQVAPDGADVPPRDAAEQAQFIRFAYALVAANHPIPSDAEVCYQVWW
jgi:hypothetical protein